MSVLLSVNDGAHTSTKPPVTVADTIRMRNIIERDDGSLATFCPDGTKFAVIVQRGNLERNTNEYSLLLWKTGKIFSSPGPTALLTMSSNSNRAAIKDVTWRDNETLAFLGEEPGQVGELYTFNIRTRRLKSLTNHATSLIYYSFSANKNRFAYVAEGPVGQLLNAKARRDGVLVTTQALAGLIAGESNRSDLGNNQAYVSDTIGSRKIDLPAPAWTFGHLAISPDGQYVVLQTHMKRIPENWKDYLDPTIAEFTRTKLRPGQLSFISEYLLVDLRTGQAKPLLTTPSLGTSIAWSPDSHSVVIAGAHLPLDNVMGDERKIRESKTFLIEVKVPGREIVEISREDKISKYPIVAEAVRWDPRSGLLTYIFSDPGWHGTKQKEAMFAKRADTWVRVAKEPPDEMRPTIALEEGMNEPPKLMALSPTTKRKAVLLDLNPQFRDLRFGKVEEINWKGSDGHDVTGGLYYPVDYERGKKYPLVIQTHGWDPKRFWIVGPYTTAFAAQPLAGSGIMVLQANEIWGGSDFDTPAEFKRETATFEGAIDTLDRMELIDRNRVGIIGFSRTGTLVAYELTQSKYKFAAASVADGDDFGTFGFNLFANQYSDVIDTVTKFYGGLPFGSTLKSWIALSPEFNLDKIETPLRLVSIGPTELMIEWDWYTSLLVLNRPVEMVYLPEGTHVLQKPWERMVSQQGNVDWFRFWLQSYEDPDPAKVAQYRRWRILRTLQEQSEK